MASLTGLMSDEIHEDFATAVADRKSNGTDHRQPARPHQPRRDHRAQMIGAMAEITVRFDADIVSVTRDAAGNVVSGSTSDAVPTSDVWTFSRLAGSLDPNWLLIATDDVAFP